MVSPDHLEEMNMSETVMLTIALGLISAFFGLLMTVIGWVGNKLYNKVDEMAKNLQEMASELHDRITGIDKRVTRIEAVEDMCQGRRASDKEQE